MKQSIALVTTLGLSLAAFGCNSGGAPVSQAQSQPGVAWKLTLKTQCADNSADSCVAGHGFTVAADGTYQLGPAPGGKVLRGKLSPDELKGIAARVAALSAPATADEEPGDSSDESSAATGQPACQAISIDSASDVTLTLITQGKQKVLASTQDSQLCFQTANPQAASALHDAIVTLAQKYYTLPFPDACADSVAALEELYPAVQSCSKDADCAYVTPDFEVVPSSSDEFIVTDAGTVAKPLVVANVQLLQARQKALTDATNAAAKACGAGTGADRYQTGSPIDGFRASIGAPVCQQKVCRAATPPATPSGH